MALVDKAVVWANVHATAVLKEYIVKIKYEEVFIDPSGHFYNSLSASRYEF